MMLAKMEEAVIVHMAAVKNGAVTRRESLAILLEAKTTFAIGSTSHVP